ncbi:unnamed protein product [Prorocentrum cordatum]|uniref:Uncharacterized protein n=1 Tax=Prorocentrum cordatum TaxID=2364126 RepID=A0ABN9SM22_9DINO|nr:unnamed protein product [Polarella glacialis]
MDVTTVREVSWGAKCTTPEDVDARTEPPDGSATNAHHRSLESDWVGGVRDRLVRPATRITAATNAKPPHAPAMVAMSPLADPRGAVWPTENLDRKSNGTRGNMKVSESSNGYSPALQAVAMSSILNVKLLTYWTQYLNTPFESLNSSQHGVNSSTRGGSILVIASVCKHLHSLVIFLHSSDMFFSCDEVPSSPPHALICSMTFCTNSETMVSLLDTVSILCSYFVTVQFHI